jgi:putative membrane protein
VLFTNQAVHEGIFEVPTADLPPLRWWSFHLGVYSLFLGAAPIIGVIAEHTNHPHVARTLVLYGCACILLAGVVLAFSNRLGSEKGKGPGMVAVLAMCVPAAIAIAAELIAWLA